MYIPNRIHPQPKLNGSSCVGPDLQNNPKSLTPTVQCTGKSWCLHLQNVLETQTRVTIPVAPTLVRALLPPSPSVSLIPLCLRTTCSSGFPGSSVVKNLPAMQEMQVRSLGWKDALEMGMATHSSVFAWEVPRTEEPGGPQSTGFAKSQTRLSN